MEKLESKRIVVKIGSSTITDHGDPLNRLFMERIAGQIYYLQGEGYEIALVSSGAVAYGKERLKGYNHSLIKKQVLASVGQGYLIETWRKVFRSLDIEVGQFLFSESDLLTPPGPLIEAMKIRIVPVINANDSVNDEEMRQFLVSADNDKLASYVATSVNAGRLILLTDVNGIHNNGWRIPEINCDEDIVINFQKKSDLGTGGMESKLSVALDFARRGGIATIAQGMAQNILLRIIDGEKVGTTVK